MFDEGSFFHEPKPPTFHVRSLILCLMVPFEKLPLITVEILASDAALEVCILEDLSSFSSTNEKFFSCLKKLVRQKVVTCWLKIINFGFLTPYCMH